MSNIYRISFIQRVQPFTDWTYPDFNAELEVVTDNGVYFIDIGGEPVAPFKSLSSCLAYCIQQVQASIRLWETFPGEHDERWLRTKRKKLNEVARLEGLKSDGIGVDFRQGLLLFTPIQMMTDDVLS